MRAHRCVVTIGDDVDADTSPNVGVPSLAPLIGDRE
jgi:hypothetical protein